MVEDTGITHIVRELTICRPARRKAVLGEPEVIRWQNGAVSSLPAEAGELSHGTFHNSQARRDRSPSVGEAEGVNEENVGFEPQVGIIKEQENLLLIGGEYGARTRDLMTASHTRSQLR